MNWNKNDYDNKTEYDDYVQAKYKRKKSRAFKHDDHNDFHDGKHFKKMKNHDKVRDNYSDYL